jgi:hypothetical protein
MPPPPPLISELRGPHSKASVGPTSFIERSDSLIAPPISATGCVSRRQQRPFKWRPRRPMMLPMMMMIFAAAAHCSAAALRSVSSAGPSRPVPAANLLPGDVLADGHYCLFAPPLFLPQSLCPVCSRRMACTFPAPLQLVALKSPHNDHEANLTRSTIDCELARRELDQQGKALCS